MQSSLLVQLHNDILLWFLSSPFGWNEPGLFGEPGLGSLWMRNEEGEYIGQSGFKLYIGSLLGQFGRIYFYKGIIIFNKIDWYVIFCLIVVQAFHSL